MARSDAQVFSVRRLISRELLELNRDDRLTFEYDPEFHTYVLRLDVTSEPEDWESLARPLEHLSRILEQQVRAIRRDHQTQ